MKLDLKALLGLFREVHHLPEPASRLDWGGATFALERNPEPSVRVRLATHAPTPVYAFETRPVSEGPASYPDDIPWVPDHSVQCALQPRSRVAVWLVAITAEQLAAVSGIVRGGRKELGGEFQQHLLDLAAELQRDTDADNMAEIGSRAAARMMDAIKQRVAGDADYGALVSEFVTDMIAAFGGPEDIMAVMETVIGVSKIEGWAVADDRTDGNDAFRAVVLNRGGWKRQLMLSGVGPAKIVYLCDELVSVEEEPT